MRHWLTNITTSSKYTTTADVERALAAASSKIEERNSVALRALEVRINGLLLPAKFVQLVVSGRWRTPSNPTRLHEKFPRGLNFYTFECLLFENAHWIQERDPVWLGKPRASSPPGDIDPGRSLIVADLGVGKEQPIALDYRKHDLLPSILLLGEADWIEIAPTIEDFVEQIGIL